MKDGDGTMLPPPSGARRPRAFSDNTPIPRDCSSGSFVSKLYRMVDTEPSTIVSWIRGGTAFCIVDPKMMAEHCLPKYFRHRRFSSLIRQLNFYSFYRVQEGQLTIYQHSFFRKGRPDLLVHIKRRGAGKAKDPWFDPLASSKPESGPINMGVLSVNSGTMNPMCYSPMSKPLTMENMSPALKPGMAQVTPPVVDLGGTMSCEEKMLDDKRWENAMSKDNGTVAFSVPSGVQMKSEMFYDESAINPTVSMIRNSNAHGAIDIDIQDFLTEDCNINDGSAEPKYDDRFCNNGPSGGVVANAKCAIVARDCMKWDSKDAVQPCSAQQTGVLNQDGGDGSSTFEDELLLDLANVEPGAWDVPLSPLNEEEDMMPWLDLCF
ncbi:TPA: hypothetical protein N0F65_010225 [Lagenidium giganteum]|uniref:HSF-type DNA-binding domain-containing protein n=1 Tax=Lagenidium giganteum TaxID=4803 RepID=A0AAV2Z0Z7_9STRA|nr:TPA: hypothetical protein N0F65_010225 [Lagenidium giganteum]